MIMTSDLVQRHPLKEKRRANKPLLERKRRARINDSLADLKHLVLSSLNKDVSKYTKMEKVDILDMTVQFLKGQCLETRKEDYSSVYRHGYSECTKEMYQSIMTMEGVDHSLKCRILSHLSSSSRSDERVPSPPPSPTLSNTSRSPIPSPTGSPVKPYISTIFDPATRQIIDTRRLIVPMVTPTNSIVTREVNTEHFKFHPQTNKKTVIRQTQIQHSKSERCYKSTEHMSRDGIKSSSNVWRPW